jgi:hypothetical protein
MDFKRRLTMKGYVGFYKGKRFEVQADTSYQAQQKMAIEHKVKKAYEITVMLAEKDGKPIIHNPTF